MRRTPRAGVGLLALIAIVLPVALFAVLSNDLGLVLLHLAPGATFLPVLISNCGTLEEPDPCPGDQFYARVDGDLASYIAGPDNGFDYRVAYYDFFNGGTNFIPPSPDADWTTDYLPDVSGGKIAFWRQEGTFGPDATISEAILVYDTTNNTTTDVIRIGPASGSYTGGFGIPMIGANTVAFVDWRTYPGELWVANLANLGAGPTRLAHNDGQTNKRFEDWLSVSPSGDVVVWQSCVPCSPGNCDIGKATLNGDAWTKVAITSDDNVEENPSADGVLIAYSKRPPGLAFDQQDICWQPVAGGTEECLQLDGYQTWPSVRGGLIAFSGVPPNESEADLYVYHIATTGCSALPLLRGASEELVNL